jgi:hypothetical protein
LRHLVALPFSGEVDELFLLTPSGYEMAAKTVAWGVILLPLGYMRVDPGTVRDDANAASSLVFIE